nr:PKD domain-containing protein [Bacteroidota bacterium]
MKKDIIRNPDRVVTSNTFLIFMLSLLFSSNLIAGIVVESTSENNLTVKVALPETIFGEVMMRDGNTYSVLRIQSSAQLAIGKPDVPGFGSWILIPNGREVSINYTMGEPLVFYDIDLPPVQPPASDEIGAGEPGFTKDAEAFAVDADYPGIFAETEPVKYKRGQSCTILWVYPYQYNPVQKKLTVYPDLQVSIQFSGVTQAIPPNLRNKNMEEGLKKMAINGETVLNAEKEAGKDHGKSQRLTEGCDMLIITHPDFKNAADTLALWRNKKGISTRILSIDTPGVLRIQDSIDEAYETWDPVPQYLLFIGDAEFIPTWHVNMHPDSVSQGRTGTDIFYADYENLLVNPKIHHDYLPEFYYGRLSVDSAAQADSLVARIIRYEKNPVNLNWFYDDMVVAAAFQDGTYIRSTQTDIPPDSVADRRFAKTAEDVKDYMDNHGYVAHRIYRTYNGCRNNNDEVFPKYWSNLDIYNFENDTSKNEIPSSLQKPNFNWTGNASDISTKVNSGIFFLLHRDHGNRHGWGEPGYDIGNVDALTNGERRPAIWSINCQTGWFDNETDDPICDSDDECFVEHWLRHSTGGSCLLFGATRTSYSGINDRLIWGWMNAIWPYFTTWHYDTLPIVAPVYQMGRVMDQGKDYMLTRIHSGWEPKRRTALEEYHVFSDPTIEMWTAFPSNFTSLAAKDAVVDGADKIGVTVMPQMRNVLIGVYSIDNTRLLGSGYTNNLGVAVITLKNTVALGEVLQLTATKHDYIPKEKIITVGSGESGYITANKTWLDDTIRVVGDITVEKGVTLTVNSGVYVEFQGHYKLNVYGRLLAEGYQNDTITFTSKNTFTGWHGIRFFDSNTNGQNDSKLIYCSLKYGKANGNGDDRFGGAVFCHNSHDLRVQHCRITGNEAITGGGIYLRNSSIIIDSSLVSGNMASLGGGLACLENSSPDVQNIIIIDNQADIAGGGLYCYEKSSPQCFKVEIDENTSDSLGGGIYLEGYINNWPEPTFDSATINGNSAGYRGGGIYAKNRSAPVLNHSTICDNSAGSDGAAIACSYAWPDLTNVTISDNTAGTSGGAIFCTNSSSPELINCILWNDSPDEVTLSSDTAYITYSDIEGGYTGTGNINSDPLFHSTRGDSTYYLTASSPCINAGNPLTPHDPDGSRVDMGAFYYHHTEIIFPPTANFSADTTYGYYPLTIHFSDEASPGTGAITGWLWDFGDSSTDTLQNPVHIYQNAGVYTVSLTVIDANDSTDIMTKSNYLTVVATPPGADFLADNTEWYKPFVVNFTDMSTQGSGAITSRLWSFGDAYTDTAQNPQHTYSAVGSYTVSLKVTDVNDSTDTKVKTDYITVLPGTYITGGYVSGTWTLDGSPYVIDGEITIHADSSLTIEPGVEILFLSHHKFIVKGTLDAQGIATDLIVFTAKNIWQGWHGLRFLDSHNSVLEYCHIQYGNSYGASNTQDSCGGGIYCNDSDIEIINCLIANNEAYKHGGGVYSLISDIQMSGNMFRYNIAYDCGGGIYGFESGITTMNDTLQNNEADCGGGLYCEGDPYPTLTITAIIKNIAWSSGGGIFCREFGRLDMLFGTISENVANSNGGGVFCGPNSMPNFNDVLVEKNLAGNNGGGFYFGSNTIPGLFNTPIISNNAGSGGGIYFSGYTDPNISLFDLSVIMNSAVNGGGIYYRNCVSPHLMNPDISANTASGENAFGGGLYFYQSGPDIFDATIRVNTAFSDQIACGGGIYLNNASNPSLYNSTINGNSASGKQFSSGGGICSDLNSSPMIDHSFICGNITSCEQQPAMGGGIFCQSNSNVNLTNVTMSLNTANAGAGGGIYSLTSSPVLLNCILWDDIPQEIIAPSGTVTATYSNIEGSWTGTGNKNSDPIFEEPLAEDFHLTWPNFPIVSSKSPCIDAGDPTSPTDPDGSVADMGVLFYTSQQAFDYGDAPDPPYPTLKINNGPLHTIDENIYLGSTIDADLNGQQDANALGDDNDGNDDDDGVVFNSVLIPGNTISVSVTASVGGYLNAWFDFNTDGDWDDNQEQIFIDEPLLAGNNNLSFQIPAWASLDTTFTRFRFCTVTGPGYVGLASDGEVEDYEVVVVDNNLTDIAIWNFNENQGNIVYDATSNHNNGNITGADWVNGVAGSALYFNGSSDYITVPHSASFDLSQSFSLQAWVKTYGTSNYMAILDKYQYYASGSEGFSLYLNGGRLRISVYSGSNGIKDVIGTSDLRDNLFHHVFASWDGSYLRVYVDGVQENETAWLYPPASTANNLGIGRRLTGWGGFMPFLGIMDEVKISQDPELKLDFGDAPDPFYPTILASNGARHLIDENIFLGTLIDNENDGYSSPQARGDDLSNLDDEDGVIFGSALVPGQIVCLSVNVSVNGKLNAWLDMNIDGDWDDPDEQVFTDEVLTAGDNTVSFELPATTVPGNAFARFRFDTVGGLNYTGLAVHGEVEDYMVLIDGYTPPWTESFETYVSGSDIVGQGGWEFWGGLPASVGAFVNADVAYDGSQSLKISGRANQTGDDIVHRFSGCDAGIWLFTIQQFIPAAAIGGTSYLVLLNRYDCAGSDLNWSTQVSFDPDLNVVTSDYDGEQLPLVKGEWARISVYIDLDTDQQHIYYNGQYLATKSWTEGISGSGDLNFAALDLWSNTLENVPVYYDDFSLEQVSCQTLLITDGWSGISAYLEPAYPGIEEMFSPISEDLVILYNQDGMYWPGAGVNSLLTWNAYSGYTIRITDDVLWQICGGETGSKMLDLVQGWNQIPVLSAGAVSTENLFSGTDLEVVKGIAGGGIYWPRFNVNQLPVLESGKAYLVKMNSPATIDFESVDFKDFIPNEPTEIFSPWVLPINTPGTHIVAFTKEASGCLHAGDVVAAFTQTDRCAGICRVIDNEKPIALHLFADDWMLGENTGFVEGERISFKLLETDGTIRNLVVIYDYRYHQETFHVNGISVVESIVTGFARKDEFNPNDIQMFPNPSNGNFTISNLMGCALVKVYTIWGDELRQQEVCDRTTTEIKGLPSGMYLIEIKNAGDRVFKKLLIK